MRVQRSDRGLQGVEARAAAAHGLLGQRLSLRDLAAVPQGAVLLFERHELARRVDPRRPARVLQQHQREEARHLAHARQEQKQQPAQADGSPAHSSRRTRRVAGGRGVALVEHEVHDAQDSAEALAQAVAAGTS